MEELDPSLHCEFAGCDNSFKMGDRSDSDLENGVKKHKKHRKSTKSSKDTAPEPKNEVKQWSRDQEEELLKNVKQYASELTGKEQTSARVQWSRVSQVADFTQVNKNKRGLKLDLLSPDHTQVTANFPCFGFCIVCTHNYDRSRKTRLENWAVFDEISGAQLLSNLRAEAKNLI